MRRLLPKTKYDPRGSCRSRCYVDFLNPVPDKITEHVADKKFGTLAGSLVKRTNKVIGLIDLPKCLAECDKKYPEECPD